jgi:hypothetical protein
VKLHHDAVSLTTLYNTARRNFSAVLPGLPDLIREAQSAVLVASVRERRRAYSALAVLYRLAALEFGLWGPGLLRARVAMDRALSAAEQAGDPLLFGGIAAMYTVQLMNQGDADNAVAVAAEVADLVASDPRADTPTGMVVAGQLDQYAAKAAARAGNGSETRTLLRVASMRAERLGRDRGAYGLYFGLANAAMQEVCSLTDLGEPQRAIRRSEGIRVEWLGSVNRIGFHCIHQARAYCMRRQDEHALEAIATGLRMAPELVRLQPTASALVRGMLQRRKRAGERLRKIARALDVKY